MAAMANDDEREAREEAVRRSQREAAEQRATRYFQRLEADRRQDIRMRAALDNQQDPDFYTLPDGWSKIPWEIGVNPYILDKQVYEPHNPRRDVPMFKIGDIIQTKYKGKKTWQIVKRVFYREEYHYFAIREYAKDGQWYGESEFKHCTIMRDWAQDMRIKFINPQLFERSFNRGTKLSIVFGEGTQQARVYVGTITRVWEEQLIINSPLIVYGYTIKFDDGDTLEPNQYRLWWLLGQTDRYLETLPYADVGVYSGGDIPIAQPGLRF